MAFPQVVALLITNLPEVWGFAPARRGMPAAELGEKGSGRIVAVTACVPV